jgi:putative membrane protein
MKWFGHVPVLIPLSWFFMAVPSYLLARAVLRPHARVTAAGRVVVVLGGSLVLLAWDVALDPAMSWITKYWVWGEEGPYYGMPLLNLFGWYVTGLALMGALALLRADEWGDGLPTRWMLGYYGANLLLPLGMIAAAGLWDAVALTAVVVAVSLWLPRLHRPRVEVAPVPAVREAA